MVMYRIGFLARPADKQKNGRLINIDKTDRYTEQVAHGS